MNRLDSSFFPTPKEVTVGIRWIRDHPIVATAVAAAATAASIVTYLKQDQDSDSEEDEIHHVVSWSDDNGGSLVEFMGEESDADEENNHDAKHITTHSSDPTKADNHIEHDPVLKPSIRRTKSNLQRSTCNLSSKVADRRGDIMSDDAQKNPSPQWGWYVAITPPQDNQYGKETSSLKVNVSSQLRFIAHASIAEE